MNPVIMNDEGVAATPPSYISTMEEDDADLAFFKSLAEVPLTEEQKEANRLAAQRYKDEPRTYTAEELQHLRTIVAELRAKYLPALNAVYAELDAYVQRLKARAEETDADDDWDIYFHIAGCSDWYDAFKDEMLYPVGRELCERGHNVDRSLLIKLLSAHD